MATVYAQATIQNSLSFSYPEIVLMASLIYLQHTHTHILNAVYSLYHLMQAFNLY